MKDAIRRTISTASVKDGLIYYPDFSGFLHCVDIKTGKPVWIHDMFAAMWSSTMVADGKVYLGDEDGDVVVMQHGREKKELAVNAMDSSVYSTVITAKGVLYVMTRNNLYAIQEGAQRK
jgi:outer membrane protein assembly factor BamB